MSNTTAPDAFSPSTDNDDATVITGKPNSRPSATKVWKEIVVKLRFQADEHLQTRDVSHLAFGVFTAMKNKFETSLSIKTNENRELRTLQAPNEDDFQKLFKVTHRRGNKTKKIRAQSWIIFRIGTAMTLTTIRKEPTVSDALKRTYGNLVYYPWTEDVHDVVPLGFFVGPMPQYMTTTQFEEEVLQYIAAKAHMEPKRIPKYRCVMETVSAFHPATEHRIRCQAFTIQVEKMNAQKLHKILEKAFTPATKQLLFVPFEGRRNQPDDFAKAVLSQAALEGKHRIVAIHGIHPDTMFEFEGILQQTFPQVMKVYRTPTTSYLNNGGEPLGRYNLMCLTTDFPTLCVALNSTLADTYLNFTQQTGSPPPDTPHAEKVRVISQYPQLSSSGSKASQTTRDSFLASQHSVLAELDFTIEDVPPERRSVRPQQNPPIPTTIHAHSTPTLSPGTDTLEAAQSQPPPNLTTPRLPSWATIVAGLSPTAPSAAEQTFTESQVQTSLAQHKNREAQRQEIALQVKQQLAEQKDEDIRQRDEEIRRQDQQIKLQAQQIQQLIAKLQEMQTSPSPPLQDQVTTCPTWTCPPTNSIMSLRDSWFSQQPDSIQIQSETSPDSFLGDLLATPKPPEHTRLYFVNANGLHHGALGGDFAEVCQTMSEEHIDIMGIAETHLDTRHPNLVRTCAKAARRTFTHSRICMASSRRTYNTSYKPGGTAMISNGPVTGRITQTNSDSMGRWCSTSYRGANGHHVTVVTAYQVCKTQPTKDMSANPSQQPIRKTAAVTQQYSMMVEQNPHTTLHPRDQFRIDMLDFLRDLQKQNHEIILMGDFNEPLGSEVRGMLHIANSCALVDLLALKIGTSSFNTYIGGSDRIDYVLVSPRVATACKAAGYEPVKYRFKGDHRGFFLDFDTTQLFQNATIPLPPPAARMIQSRHRPSCETYIRLKHQYLTDHRWFERLAEATKTPTFNRPTIEGLDRDWTRASIQAEKHCRRPPNPPYSLELASKRTRKNALNIILSAARWNIPMLAAREKAVLKCTETLPESLEECQSEYKQLRKDIRRIEAQVVSFRRSEQEAQLQARLADGEKAGAIALRNIMVAEETKEMWRQLRALNPVGDQGITTIDVPTDGNFETNHCKECTDWTTIDEPKNIEAALLKRNRIHFGQAQGTPPTISPLREKINWSASTYESELILEGDNIDSAMLSAAEKLMLTHFRRTTNLDTITAQITEAEWEGKMKVWNENTSTSPSGMHLGHHKAIIKPFPVPENYDYEDPDKPPLCEDLRNDLVQGQLQLVNYAIKHSYCYDRWSKVATFMIQKEPGNTKVHRLRVIHLYEADFNLLLGVKWRQLTQHCIDSNLLNPWQFGGLPGRDATTPVFLEELQWEISRASRRGYGPVTGIQHFQEKGLNEESGDDGGNDPSSKKNVEKKGVSVKRI
ncbi:endonuclease/exonuclease/phosphatase family protein [Nitzschia inconspicua]|uniref:Endonuclease/exonuclease/phosphatase family protein n=1 Tax=Nitzschia inconspicua TaxID=303405 RepID=A0A9K3LTZ8_9STRA|nr:endonuclease/exonuclease/phosphatase family protein [Nitzschia inconspicua]